MLPGVKKYIFIAIVIVISAIIGSSYFLNQLNTSRLSSDNSSARSFPSEVIGKSLPAGFNVQSKDPNDTSGRTLVFDTANTNKHMSGTGIFNRPSRDNIPESLSYIIGAFDGWETIVNSKDKYIKTRNPITGEDLSKFRIAMEISPFIKDRDEYTAISVIDLSSLERPYVESINKYKKVNELTEAEINTILKEGDVVVLTTYVVSPGVIMKDPAGVPVAAQVMLRRFGGVTAL